MASAVSPTWKTGALGPLGPLRALRPLRALSGARAIERPPLICERHSSNSFAAVRSHGLGSDGKTKDAGDDSDTPTSFGAAPPDAKKNAKEVKVTVGLEGDFYTEVSSPEIKEGMTVLVDSKAGELQQDMSIFGGGM